MAYLMFVVPMSNILRRSWTVTVHFISHKKGGVKETLFRAGWLSTYPHTHNTYVRLMAYDSGRDNNFTASDAKPIKFFNAIQKLYIIPQRITSFCLILNWSIGCFEVFTEPWFATGSSRAPHQTSPNTQFYHSNSPYNITMSFGLCVSICLLVSCMKIHHSFPLGGAQ